VSPLVRTPRWFVVGLVVIALVGLGVRLTYTLTVAVDQRTVGDALTYHRLAQSLSQGDGYVRTDDPEPQPTAEFPPLFPAVVSVASWLGADTIDAQKVFTSVLGISTVVLVGLLGRRVDGPATGLVAAALTAVYPMLFQADGALMAESLYAPLVTAILLATYWAIDRPSPARWATVGALTGLAALTRTEALLVVAVLVVPAALRHGRRTTRDRLALAGVATLAVLVVTGPWLVRNWLTFDRFVPISNNSGTLVAGANCERTYSGDFEGLWLLECIDPIDTEGMDEAEAFSRYRQVGTDFARDNLSDVPRVVSIRVLRTFGLYDVSTQINFETLEGRSNHWQTVGHRMFLVLAPLAVAGAVVLVRRRAVVWPLLAPLVVVAVTAVVSYGNQRFRMAAEPGIVVMAAVSTTAGVAALRSWLTTLLGTDQRHAPPTKVSEKP
jgi:hypothetical protein